MKGQVTRLLRGVPLTSTSKRAEPLPKSMPTRPFPRKNPHRDSVDAPRRSGRTTAAPERPRPARHFTHASSPHARVSTCDRENFSLVERVYSKS